MKKSIIFASLLAGVLMFSSCESDRDDNPVLNEPTTFTLNVPAYVNTVYDLENSTSLELTCSQPNYGYTAATTYTVEVSTTQDFASFETLASTYTTAKMNVAADEIAVAATNLLVAQGATEADFPKQEALYFRLKASVGTDQFGNELGVIYSNVISLPNVKLYFALPPVLVPENLYIIGNHNGWNWNNCLPMTLVWGTDNVFWRMTYLDGGWKFNSALAWDGGEVGYDGVQDIVDNAGANISRSDDGNIVAGTPGWYLVVITANVVGRDVQYAVTINKPEVWMIGDVTGVDWQDRAAGWQLEVPTTADGEFVSPAFAAAATPENGVRVYCPIEGHDPWHSEFMVFGQKIVYRAIGGDQERVTAPAGQKLYLNFSNDTGRIE